MTEDKFIIIGAGGHAKVIADMMLCQNKNLLGFLDDNLSLVGRKIFDLPVLGMVKQLKEFAPTGVIVGIGDNVTRSRLVRYIELDTAPTWVSVTHLKAIIASYVHIGAGTVVAAGAVVNPDCVIGQHTIINTGATIDHDCVIGDFVHVAPGAHLAGGISIGDGVLLGVGCCVIPGCRIGEGSIVGAGAVVVRDIPPGVIAKGIPARW